MLLFDRRFERETRRYNQDISEAKRSQHDPLRHAECGNANLGQPPISILSCLFRCPSDLLFNTIHEAKSRGLSMTPPSTWSRGRSTYFDRGGVERTREKWPALGDRFVRGQLHTSEANKVERRA